MREADHYDHAAAKLVHCRLCPHRCEIPPGEAGICRVRSNMDGVLYAASYEEIGRLEPGAVEGPPLFHFVPGAMHVVVGDSTTPTGRMIRLRTVWIVEPADPRPRFVTAYPAR